MTSFNHEQVRVQISSDLLDIKAVFLRPDEPFTWASGIKSPIYCDNRLTLSYPEVRGHVEQGLAGLIKANYPECECVMGTATAGIAHAALVADILGLPMGYVRGGSKSHGRENKIEGLVVPGQKVVVVEDLISTGGSSVEAAQALRDAGLEVLAIVSIFTYNMLRAEQTMVEAGLEYAALTDLDALVVVAEDQGYLTPEQTPQVLAFRDNPAGWAPAGSPRGDN